MDISEVIGLGFRQVRSQQLQQSAPHKLLGADSLLDGTDAQTSPGVCWVAAYAKHERFYMQQHALAWPQPHVDSPREQRQPTLCTCSW